MYPQLVISRLATTLLCLLLVLMVDASRVGATCQRQQCGRSLHRSLQFTRVLQRESAALIKTYKASQGDSSELFCKMMMDNVPDPTISGLEPSERMQSMSSHISTFLQHLRRVTEQQMDLQTPSSPLLRELTYTYNRTSSLGSQVDCLYQTLFPNCSVLELVGEEMPVPPAQNIFQQKVYGCVVLKRLKDFMSNVARELKVLKQQVCTKRT